MTSYDDNNIFARILRGEIPCHKVYETDSILAFLDAMPQCDGHTLVVPKAKARNLLDADPETLATLIKAVQHVARGVQRAFGADGLLIQQFNGATAGQTVFHLHVHIVPRKEGMTLRGHGATMEKPEILAVNAEKLRQALSS